MPGTELNRIPHDIYRNTWTMINLGASKVTLPEGRVRRLRRFVYKGKEIRPCEIPVLRESVSYSTIYGEVPEDRELVQNPSPPNPHPLHSPDSDILQLLECDFLLFDWVLPCSP